ncbi:hypothetical protein EVAR_21275_1 [Eumeta japonica]|uniref:Uncharacterized protein n=1 Tax=Eumeta variegata TaxID=151549 RepID=A0A4C1WPW9_EUMVA|nr:hypothetical protein EVAR_21275_1 [Eumeta japonica]
MCIRAAKSTSCVNSLHHKCRSVVRRPFDVLPRVCVGRRSRLAHLGTSLDRTLRTICSVDRLINLKTSFDRIHSLTVQKSVTAGASACAAGRSRALARRNVNHKQDAKRDKDLRLGGMERDESRTGPRSKSGSRTASAAGSKAESNTDSDCDHVRERNQPTHTTNKYILWHADGS